jgi:hypothetical protein
MEDGGQLPPPDDLSVGSDAFVPDIMGSPAVSHRIVHLRATYERKPTAGMNLPPRVAPGEG